MIVMEQWKRIIIDGEVFDYEVNRDGYVRKVSTGFIPKLSKNRNGYNKVYLKHRGKQHQFYIHRLVMLMFAPVEGCDKLEVDHINANKDDNRLENLRWVTHEENVQYYHNEQKIKRG